MRDKIYLALGIVAVACGGRTGTSLESDGAARCTAEPPTSVAGSWGGVCFLARESGSCGAQSSNGRSSGTLHYDCRGGNAVLAFDESFPVGGTVSGSTVSLCTTKELLDSGCHSELTMRAARSLADHTLMLDLELRSNCSEPCDETLTYSITP